MSVCDPIELLRRQCAEVGFDLDRAGPSLVARMRLLAECSKTFDDAARMASYARRVFRHYDALGLRAFSALEQQTVVLACLFSDLGKSGPKHADAAGCRLVAEAFSIEDVRDDQQPMAAFFRAHFADGEARIARFLALGLDPSMTLRAFWNLHSGWTLDVAEAEGIPREAVAAAATHHMLENVNPRQLVGDDGRYTERFGENLAFDRAEKLVIVLDKYDAVRRRGHEDHDGAVAWLRGRVAKSVRFKDDAELSELVAAVAAALRD